MVYIVCFVCVGCTCMIGQQFLALTGILAITLVVGTILWGYLWLSDAAGTSHVIISSWQFLSGVDSPNDVVVSGSSCPDGHGGSSPGLGAIFVALLNLALAIINVPLGLAALVIAPAGLVFGIGMAFVFLWNLARRPFLYPNELAVEPSIASRAADFLAGLKLLWIGMALVIASGLMMRIMHAVSLANC